MKIEINGFTIEIMTDDVNLTLKVSDASGKELSNNTYDQSSKEEPVQTAVPSAEDTASNDQNTSDSYIPTFEEFKKGLKK